MTGLEKLWHMAQLVHEETDGELMVESSNVAGFSIIPSDDSYFCITPEWVPDPAGGAHRYRFLGHVRRMRRNIDPQTMKRMEVSLVNVNRALDKLNRLELEVTEDELQAFHIALVEQESLEQDTAPTMEM